MATTTEVVRESYAMTGAGLDLKRIAQARREEFDEWLAGVRDAERRLGQHDMDASLFNEIARLLMSHPDMKALFALERLRSQYGRSTRRTLGLDA